MRAKIHKFALAGKLHPIQPRQKTNTNRELFVKLTAMLRGGELEKSRIPPSALRIQNIPHSTLRTPH
jgi:hypothetical protein